jgi:hypothetical protein
MAKTYSESSRTPDGRLTSTTTLTPHQGSHMYDSELGSRASRSLMRPFLGWQVGASGHCSVASPLQRVRGQPVARDLLPGPTPPAILTRRSEAACIDPQARMLLENIQSLGSRGDDSRTGVYVGCMYTGEHAPVFHPCPSLHRLPAGKDAVKPSQSTWMASSRPWAWPTQ